MRANERTEERMAQYFTRRFQSHSTQCADFALRGSSVEKTLLAEAAMKSETSVMTNIWS